MEVRLGSIVLLRCGEVFYESLYACWRLLFRHDSNLHEVVNVEVCGESESHACQVYHPDGLEDHTSGWIGAMHCVFVSFAEDRGGCWISLWDAFGDSG